MPVDGTRSASLSDEPRVRVHARRSGERATMEELYEVGEEMVSGDGVDKRRKSKRPRDSLVECPSWS